MIGRIALAVVVAVATGLLLVGLLGPLLVDLKAPVAVTVGAFFVSYGWVIGLLCGLAYFFGAGRISFRTPPSP